MEIRARVLEIRGDMARLVCEDDGHCGLCTTGRACGMRLFGGATVRSVDVPRREGTAPPLETGDSVSLSVADGAIVRAAAAVYLPPVAGLLAGAALARLFGAGGETLALAAALAGAWLGVLAGRRLGPYRFRPVVAGQPATGPPDG